MIGAAILHGIINVLLLLIVIQTTCQVFYKLTVVDALTYSLV